MATLRTVTVKPSGGDYTSLNAALSGESKNLVALDRQLDIACYAMEDTTLVYFFGWTVDATRYVRVYTPSTERHDGKWNTAKYRLNADADYDNVLNVESAYLRLEGLQIGRSSGNGSYACIYVSAPNCWVDACIITTSVVSTIGVVIANASCKVRNSILYGLAAGTYAAGDNNPVFQNCTIAKCTIGMEVNYSAYTATNCLATGNTSGDFTTASGRVPTVTYCASGDATADDWGGAGNRINQTFTFTNYAGNDFHLGSGDAGAKDFGTDLSGQFTTDVDGQTRSGTWDIGADEYVAAGGPFLVTVPAGSMGLSGKVPILVLPRTMPVPQATMGLTGKIPAALTPRTVIVPVGSMAATGKVPVVVLPRKVVVPIGTVAITGKVPAVFISLTIPIPTGSLVFTGRIPKAMIPFAVAVPKMGLVLTGRIPVVNAGANVPIPAGVLALAGKIPVITVTGNVLARPGVGHLTITVYVPGGSLWHRMIEYYHDLAAIQVYPADKIG